MKILKYLTYSLALILMVASCDKHEILFNTDPITDTDAEFQLHYFEPINNTAAYYIDSVFVNDVLYSSVNGSGQLLPYNGIPGGSVGRFFAVKSGEVNFKFYRKGELVYNQNVTLAPGKQNVFVHNLEKAPAVVDNGFPYWNTSSSSATPETFDTDSVASVMFVNMLYEDATTPYSGKLQYQYEDVRTKEWKNVGEPVAFGEGTTRVNVKVVKTTHNSSGNCYVNYRILDKSGNILKVYNSGGKEVDYSDYWRAYIGRAYMHIYSGVRTAKPTQGVKVWTSL